MKRWKKQSDRIIIGEKSSIRERAKTRINEVRITLKERAKERAHLLKRYSKKIAIAGLSATLLSSAVLYNQFRTQTLSTTDFEKERKFYALKYEREQNLKMPGPQIKKI